MIHSVRAKTSWEGVNVAVGTSQRKRCVECLTTADRLQRLHAPRTDVLCLARASHLRACQRSSGDKQGVLEMLFSLRKEIPSVVPKVNGLRCTNVY
jgi:hypothetical protein